MQQTSAVSYETKFHSGTRRNMNTVTTNVHYLQVSLVSSYIVHTVADFFLGQLFDLYRPGAHIWDQSAARACTCLGILVGRARRAGRTPVTWCAHDYLLGARGGVKGGGCSGIHSGGLEQEGRCAKEYRHTCVIVIVWQESIFCFTSLCLPLCKHQFKQYSHHQ